MSRPGSQVPETRKPTGGGRFADQSKGRTTRDDDAKLARSIPQRNSVRPAERHSRVERSSLDVGDVKAATNLVALVAEHVALKRSGRGFLGLCPFHQEKTPSFRVDPERGWYCHGEGRGGDEISFVMQLTGCSFPEALHHLAERAGIQPRKLAPGSIRRAIDERQRRHQEHQAQLSAVRQRWRHAIHRHDDLEGLCFALGVAERRDLEHRLELTRSLFRQPASSMRPLPRCARGRS